MQLEVNMRHILKILTFSESMVMAIQVYEDESRPGHYIAWDGQHTSIALHIILTKVFVNVPTAMVLVYCSNRS